MEVGALWDTQERVFPWYDLPICIPSEESGLLRKAIEAKLLDERSTT